MQSKHNQPDISYEKKILAGVRETVQNKSRNKHSTENFSCDISFCSLWIPATITIQLFVCSFQRYDAQLLQLFSRRWCGSWQLVSQRKSN